MPIYEYKCENGHVFDVIQKMSDEALTACEECGARAERVLHPVAVHFKGSGFYNTDYGKKKGAGEAGKESGNSADSGSSSDSGASSDSASSSDSGKSDSKKSDSKATASAD